MKQHKLIMNFISRILMGFLRDVGVHLYQKKDYLNDNHLLTQMSAATYTWRVTLKQSSHMLQLVAANLEFIFLCLFNSLNEKKICVHKSSIITTIFKYLNMIINKKKQNIYNRFNFLI